MLDFVDETYRQMALFVPVLVIFAALFIVLSGWNEEFSSCIQDRLEKILCNIRTVGNQAFKIQLGYQSLRLSNFMLLAVGQAKAKSISQGIDAHMDFGDEPASAAAERLFGMTSVFLMRRPHMDGPE